LTLTIIGPVCNPFIEGITVTILKKIKVNEVRRELFYVSMYAISGEEKSSHNEFSTLV